MECLPIVQELLKYILMSIPKVDGNARWSCSMATEIACLTPLDFFLWGAVKNMARHLQIKLFI